MGHKTIAAVLFVLAAILLVLAWVVQAVPPAVTALGFIAIGYHIGRTTP